ncbi:EFR1 family ferrodoxin [Clostridium rectalis]|uniref:EFR1 family ferrodoxin n=1 Tax=Clostridium rectalis TaxID=2040295 RepID=UPI000F630576|nr:EFR1 family ferrodoxin [Clostridium rectalis]
MKGVLYYFSGTGNTKWVADRFEENFKYKNIRLDLLNIENKDDISIEGYEFMIIGTAIYAGTEPKLVDDFINRLPNSNNKLKVIVYSTQGAKTASAVGILKRNLQKKGYNVVIETMFQMGNNYYFAFGKKPDKDEIKNIIDKAKYQVENIVEDFLNNIEVKSGITAIRTGFAQVTAKVFIKFLPSMSKNLKATDKCINCGLCLRNCPKGNIIFENGVTVFHSNCMLCLRCIHLCPVNAITYKDKTIEQTQKEIIKCLHIK